METFTRYIISIIACLALASPPGTCCVFVPTSQPNVSTPKTSCCHKSVPERSDRPLSSPAKSNLTCCCVREAKLPERPGFMAELPDLQISLVHDAILNKQPVDLLTDLVPHHSGPRLQILLRVWRC